MSDVASASRERVASLNGEAAGLPESLSLELIVRDREMIAEFCAFEPGEERDRFAADALRIGVMALKQARGEIDAGRIRHESDRLLEALGTRLEEHARLTQERLTTQLREYFDPNDGRFHERINRLIQQDGELETLIRRQIGCEDSELSKTLARHIGEGSELMKLLSPAESEGLLAVLSETLETQLVAQREKMLSQFSLDNKEGALARFIEELSERQGKLTGELSERIDEVVKEFSLDEDDSALNRLVANMRTAQRTITDQFSLDNDESALSRLKRTLEETNASIHGHLSLDQKDSALSRLKSELLTILKEHWETNQKFQEEVKVSLKEMAARKREAEKSTRHGLAFEDALFEFVFQEAQQRGDVATNTSNSTGLINRCKVGDAVVELGPENAAAGARIVLEAKEDAKYNLPRAREEIDQARKNRAAQIGVFVFSKRTAPEGIEAFARYGDDVLVVWDAEDAETDLYLRAALSLARALSVRKRGEDDLCEVELGAMDRSVLEIEKRAQQLDQIETSCNTIKNSAETILTKAQSTRKSLLREVGALQEHIEALKAAFAAAE